MYKVFVKYQTIIFASKNELLYLPQQEIVNINPENIRDFKKQMKRLQNGNNRNTIVVTDTPYNRYQRTFISSYYPITAAGGVVVNCNNNSILVIKRDGIWDLPKGKQDPGENLAGCARREIREETGIEATLVSPLPFITRHVYHQANAGIIKSTYWFLMTAEDEEPKRSTPEEGISEILWGSSSFIESTLLPDTFPLIREVLGHFQP
jgi:8-oxo-dGTP pyrophosphatase MutT (NUDIX family)